MRLLRPAGLADCLALARIPFNEVRAGFSLAVDRGRGYQLFQVENVTVKETRDDDGNRQPRRSVDAYVRAGARECRAVGA